jgi:predicted AlkP superfamily phosphohydrolase/phosphomutase
MRNTTNSSFISLVFRVSGLIALIFFGSSNIANAYIGPGAGFAFISSFFILILTVILAILTFITWPVRAIFMLIKNRRLHHHSKVNRIVVVGLDGLDPSLAQSFMKDKELPNFSDLKQKGSFRALRTTTPAISPVAWSTFSTGVNPGKHRIFDFYTRDPKNYMPILSSAHISSSTNSFKIGPLKLPLRRAQIKFLRKSRSFWKILGEHGIFSSILRVPITFPPEKFYGACLSAMCAPDLLGTQGTFTLFTTEDPDSLENWTGGSKVHLKIENSRFHSQISGPSIGENGSKQSLEISLEGEIDYEEQSIDLKIAGNPLKLKAGHYSPWVKLEFRAGLTRRIRGIARFLITEMKPHLKIYMTPINIDPEKPALPISHPFFYSIILSKLHGSFASLGLAEDTWALNARVIDEGAFLEQTYDIYEERKQHLMNTLKKTKKGLIVTVFDTTDRIQHMFFRYLSPDHPANRDKDTTEYKNVIKELYQKMDTLIGEIQQHLNEDDLMIIMSDHGFKPFKWGVNLNTWLWKEGYLALKEGCDPGSEWFADVDWAKTRAYAYGLAGIFLNVRGRESCGQVKPGEERISLQHEIKQKLESLMDTTNGLKPIRRAIITQEALKGPYTVEAPDLIIGYAEGFRASWNSAIGKITDNVIENNTRSWSGDHCVDPDLVPGVFFSNWMLEDKSPGIEDIGPTILNVFGMAPNAFHDGKILRIYRKDNTHDSK